MVYIVGTWRSSVARTLGVGEVAGSNPVVPTIYEKLRHINVFQALGYDEDDT
jgi:hypothetical protein